MIRRTWPPRLGVVLGYASVALLFTWPLPATLDTHFTGDPGGDTGVYVWNQWVFHHEVIAAHQNPLTTDQILSLTQRVDLSTHNYTAFLNVLALPLIGLLGVVTTFNIVYLAATVLTALFTYLLCRRVTGASRPEAWLAGLAFAWSPVLVARSTGHFSLVAAAPLAAFLLCLIIAERSRRTRDAALAGLTMAWAAFCDVYYAVFCLLIASAYYASHMVRVQRTAPRGARPWVWVLDVLVLCVAGLVVGLLFHRGGQPVIFGFSVSIRGLYTPVLVLTLLVLARAIVWWHPRVMADLSWAPGTVRATAVGVIACAALLSPVLYGIGERMVDGRYVNPQTFWRSSPRGVDLLAWVDPNPNHPIARFLLGDKQSAAPTAYVEYTAALSLVALGVVGFAIWRAGYRPRFGWVTLAIGSGLLALGPFVYVAGFNTHVPAPWSLLRYAPILGAARTPTRFAVVTALALAVLLASALVALRQRYPERRRLLLTVVGAALAFELFPGPRTLFSASISPLYEIVAADPRPVRLLELPFGVRDGVSSVGNFSARYQFHQTLHGKRLIGGYLSRISRRRLESMRQDYPIVDALITLSEGGRLTTDQRQRFDERQPAFIERARLGWVVIDRARSPDALVEFALHAFELEEVARDGSRVLYRPAANADGTAPSAR